MRAGRASGHDGMVRPLQSVGDRHVSGRQIDQTAWDEEWRDAARPSLFQHERGFSDAGQPADTGSDHHPCSDLVFVADRLPARVVESLPCRTHREDDEVIYFALLLRFHPLIRIEGAVGTIAAWNLAGNFRG
jgi:hypothetical protein